MPFSNADSLSIRRNTHMRSLIVEYQRNNEVDEIMAELYTAQQVDMNIILPVVMTDTNGIELQLPIALTGIFYLKIRDGVNSLFERIAIQ